jgi:hypothetical protein
VSDPLASLTPPYDPKNPPPCTAAPSAATGTTTWGNSAGTITCYSGNIKINNTVTMDPGTYVFTGTLDFSGGGSLSGTGVTLYFAGPNGTLGGSGNGNTTVNLTAPTSGPYNGILIYQDPTDTNTAEFNGTPNTTLTGVIYIPGALLEFSGNTNGKVTAKTTYNLTTVLIVNQLYVKGNATLNIINYNTTVSNPPITAVALVE